MTWWRWDTQVIIPVHGDLQILIDYHSFNANQQKRLLSYDVLNIKKETSNPFSL